MSDNTPDFDNMTPEEVMAWMETLAKRQGASEGFTTAADMDIAEVDPNSAVIDEPGYVPYGQENKQPAKMAASQPPAQQQSATPPAAEVKPPPAEPVRPQTPPAAEVKPPEPVPDAVPEADSPVDEGALAWLENLAADQGDELFNLDLSDLPEPVDEPNASESVNPMTWLEDLARSQVAEPSLERLGAEAGEEDSEKLDPFAEGVNPMEWLETLAKRQGTKPEELTTPANMNIPAQPAPEPAERENTADWLTSLAGEEGYNESGVTATQPAKQEDVPDDMRMDVIQDAIANGTVTREQMQYFLDQQADQLAQQPEEEFELFDLDEEAQPEPAQEDWLSEVMPAPEPEPETPKPPIETLFDAPPPSPDMPDWLKEDLLDQEVMDLDSIFEPEEQEEEAPAAPSPAASKPDMAYEVDSTDPWVEAFDLEYEQGGAADIDNVPDWYSQNLNDPARIAAAEGQAGEAQDDSLQEAALLPENDLPVGQAQAVPGWATSFETSEPEPAAEAEEQFEDMPDWLREVEATVTPDDVPDWLVETISEPEPEPEPPPQAAVQPPEPTPAPPPPAPKPTPVAQPAARPTSGELSTALERARDREQSGDLEGALDDYESLIRSNAELEMVVSDLSQLVQSYKTVPSVYRVLGDGLMRQGKLQQALNTYRQALNQI